MASYNFIDLGLPQLPEMPTDGKTGLTGANTEPALRQAYFAIQNLAEAVGQQLQVDTPLTGYQNTANAAKTIGENKRRLYAVTSEAIDYGELVNIWSDAGVLKAQLADATDDTKPCHGISNSPGTIALGAVVEVVLPDSYVTSISGATPGQQYWLSTTPGAVQNSAPAGAGNIQQVVGFAIAAAEFYFNPPYGWILVP